MLTVINQENTNQYRIRYYYLKWDSEISMYRMIGSDADTHELVTLGIYRFYKQAIDVFARMDYKDNDLMYFKKTKKEFYMPENIIDPQVCIQVYGNLY